MSRRSRSLAVLCLAAALGLAAQPAMAGNHEKSWNRGCADAKAGTYDRAKHGDAYEKGWQACKQNQDSQQASSGGQSDWERGRSDARAGTYNRANHNDQYEDGWQSCNSKKNSNADREAEEGANRQKQWDRGCADAKANSYDRAHPNADYEAGWSACKSN